MHSHPTGFSSPLSPLLLLLGVHPISAQSIIRFYRSFSFDSASLSGGTEGELWSRCGHVVTQTVDLTAGVLRFSGYQKSSLGSFGPRYLDDSRTVAQTLTAVGECDARGGCTVTLQDDGAIVNTFNDNGEVNAAFSIPSAALTTPDCPFWDPTQTCTFPVGCTGNTDEAALNLCECPGSLICVDQAPSQGQGFVCGCPPGQFPDRSGQSCVACSAPALSQAECEATPGRFHHVCTGVDGDSSGCYWCARKPVVASWPVRGVSTPPLSSVLPAGFSFASDPAKALIQRDAFQAALQAGEAAVAAAGNPQCQHQCPAKAPLLLANEVAKRFYGQTSLCVVSDVGWNGGRAATTGTEQWQIFDSPANNGEFIVSGLNYVPNPPNSLLLHPYSDRPGEVRFDLGTVAGVYTDVSMLVGIDDMDGDCGNGVGAEVWATVAGQEERMIARIDPTFPITSASGPVSLHVTLPAGTSTLSLRMVSRGDYTCDEGVLLFPMLHSNQACLTTSAERDWSEQPMRISDVGLQRIGLDNIEGRALVHIFGDGFSCSSVLTLDGVDIPVASCTDLDGGAGCSQGNEQCGRLTFRLWDSHPLFAEANVTVRVESDKGTAWSRMAQGNFKLNRAQPTPSPTFFAPRPVVSRATPDNLRLSGGQQVLLEGSGFQCSSRILLADANVQGLLPCAEQMTGAVNNNSNSSIRWVSSCTDTDSGLVDDTFGGRVCSRMVFTSGSRTINQTGYIKLSVLNNEINPLYARRFDTFGLLLYTDQVECAAFGQYGVRKPCTCPAGACCPGFARLFPTAGHWSRNESSLPRVCPNPEACPGAATETSDASSGERACQLTTAAILGSSATGVQTALCAKGYEGVLCSQCADGFYSLGDNVCASCGAEADDKAQLVGLLVASVGLLLFEAFCIAALPEPKLYLVISSIIGMQQFLVVGSANAQSVAVWVGDVFAALSFLNWDVQFVKPGCSIPRVSLVAVFWVTLLVFLVAALLFIAAAAVRGHLMKKLPSSLRSQSKAKNPDPAPFPGGTSTAATPPPSKAPVDKVFKRRAVHALVILACLAYLQMAMRVVSGIHCSSSSSPNDEEDALRLVASLDIVCYSSSHTATAVVMWMVLFGFVLGFPVWALFISHRSSHIHAGKFFNDPKRAQKYGYLYRGCKIEFWWVRWVNFPIIFSLALRPVWGRVPPFFFFGLYAMLLLSLFPYDKWIANVFNGGLALLNALHALVYGFLVGSVVDQVFMVLLSLALLAAGVLARKRQQAKDAQKQQDKVEKAQAATPNVDPNEPGAEQEMTSFEMQNT